MKKNIEFSLLSLIRKDLQENFTPYSSAASEMGKMAEMSYLNANENPYPFEGLEGLETYDVQQPAELVKALARTYKTDQENIVVTRGSDESIDLLIRIFCQSGQDAILTCPPTFGMYSVYSALQGARHVKIPLIERDRSFFLDKQSIIEKTLNPDNNIKIIFLCNPNSPTGNLFLKKDILDIIDAVKSRAVVIVDEAYIDFSIEESFVSYLGHLANLIILRTMSKIHALAGERVGCALCGDRDFMAFMRGCLAPYPVPKSVAKNAVEALRQAAQKQDTMIANIRAQRDILMRAFQNAEQVAHVYPSETNFILVAFKTYEDAQFIMRKALKAQIVLRDVSGKAETPHCLRISVGPPEVNKKLITLL